MSNKSGTNLADYINLVAALISIFIFLTGITSLNLFSPWNGGDQEPQAPYELRAPQAPPHDEGPPDSVTCMLYERSGMSERDLVEVGC